MARRTPRMTRVNFQILLSLAVEDLHGYAIKLDVEERTAGAIKLGSGTLYEAIQRLDGCGWIEEVAPEAVDEPRGRKRYRLTPDGRRTLEAELARLAESVEFARLHELLPDVGPA